MDAKGRVGHTKSGVLPNKIDDVLTSVKPVFTNYIS